MENFFDKIVETWDICNFFSLASLLSYFLDPPFSACQQGSPQGTRLRSLVAPPSASTLLGPQALPEQRTGRPLPCIPGWDSSLQPCSLHGTSWTGDTTHPATRLCYGNQLCAPDHSFRVACMEERESVAFPHKSHPPTPTFVASGKPGRFFGYEDMTKSFHAPPSHCLPGVQPRSAGPRFGPEGCGGPHAKETLRQIIVRGRPQKGKIDHILP